jgi:hypothetical protein
MHVLASSSKHGWTGVVAVIILELKIDDLKFENVWRVRCPTSTLFKTKYFIAYGGVLLLVFDKCIDNAIEKLLRSSVANML